MVVYVCGRAKYNDWFRTTACDDSDDDEGLLNKEYLGNRTTVLVSYALITLSHIPHGNLVHV